MVSSSCGEKSPRFLTSAATLRVGSQTPLLSVCFSRRRRRASTRTPRPDCRKKSGTSEHGTSARRPSATTVAWSFACAVSEKSPDDGRSAFLDTSEPRSSGVSIADANRCDIHMKDDGVDDEERAFSWSRLNGVADSCLCCKLSLERPDAR